MLHNALRCIRFTWSRFQQHCSQTRGNHKSKELNLLLIILFSPLNDEDFNENFMYKNIINVTKLIPVRSYPMVRLPITR